MLQPKRVPSKSGRFGIRLGLQARILERIIGGDDGQLDVAGHHFGGFAIALGNEIADFERRHFAGDLAGKSARDRTTAIRRMPTLAGQQVVPERRRLPMPIGRNDADAGDDDSSHVMESH